MHPLLFGIIPSYGFFIVSGAVFASVAAIFRKRGDFLKNSDVFFTSIIVFVFGLLGAKLFSVAGQLKYVINGQMEPWELLFSGLMFYGGVFGGFFAILFCSKIWKLPAKQLFDAVAAGLPLAQAFGRLGCFMAGCCYGKPTDSAIGVVFSSPAAQNTPVNTPLIPTQLIESAFCLILFIALIIIFSKKRKDGMLTVSYLLSYAVFRFIIEFFRGDESRGFVGHLSWSQFISLVIVILTVVILLIEKAVMKKRFPAHEGFLTDRGIVLNQFYVFKRKEKADPYENFK